MSAAVVGAFMLGFSIGTIIMMIVSMVIQDGECKRCSRNRHRYGGIR